MLVRGITKADYDYVVSVLDTWWGGPSPERASTFFFYELGEQALIAEEDGEVVGFLLGFLTPSRETGYIHLVGIEPSHRRGGVGKRLYEQFFESCARAGAKQIKAIATVGHDGSMRFHEALGFSAQEVPDYAGPGRPRIVFTKRLAAA